MNRLWMLLAVVLLGGSLASNLRRRQLLSGINVEIVKNATLLAEQLHEPHRAHTLQKVLGQASGIYADKSRVKSPRLEKTVLVNVVESNSKMDPEAVIRYKRMLHNHL